MNEFLDTLDALLISNQTNVRYLSGFIPVEEGHREAQLFITKDTTYLLTNILYKEKANGLAQSHDRMRVVILSAENPLPAVLSALIKEKGFTNIGFEEHTITVAEHGRLLSEIPGIQLIPAGGRIEKARMVKQKEEIDYIRDAVKITDNCFSEIIKDINAGISEKELAWRIEAYIRTQGYELAFAPIVAFNGNASQPHYAPSDIVRLSSPGLILLDFGARSHGYCADMTRVIFFGTPLKEWELAYDAVRTAQEKAISLLTSGEKSGAALDQIAKDEIASRGFPPFEHSLGHSLGLDIHESPRLSIFKDDTLQPGMVFSVEPGLYVEGKFGIRIEDLILLKDNGPEIISTSPKNLIAISP